MRNATTVEKAAYWLVADRIPVTKLIITADVLTFFAVYMFKVEAIRQYLAFDSRLIVAHPWALVTYPLVGLTSSPFCLLFSAYWLWWAGGSLERSWGSRTFAFFFFLMSAISAAGLTIGALVAGTPIGAAGLLLPVAGVTVAFAMLNPEQVILFFFIIPMKLKYLALLDVILVLVGYGRGPGGMIVGLFALLGCVFSYLYVTRGSRLWFGERPSRHREREKIIRLHRRRSLNPFSWYTTYRERKRLKDFLNKSGFSD